MPGADGSPGLILVLFKFLIIFLKFSFKHFEGLKGAQGERGQEGPQV